MVGALRGKRVYSMVDGAVARTPNPSHEVHLSFVHGMVRGQCQLDSRSPNVLSFYVPHVGFHSRTSAFIFRNVAFGD